MTDSNLAILSHAFAVGRDEEFAARAAPGFFMIRLVRGGAEVPAAIFLVPFVEEGDADDARMEMSPHLEATIRGEPASVGRVAGARGREITEAEYRFQMADHAWLREWAPGDPKANPRRPVDVRAMPPVRPPATTNQGKA